MGTAETIVMASVLKIAVVGPESTGKSTMSALFSKAYTTPFGCPSMPVVIAKSLQSNLPGMTR